PGPDRGRGGEDGAPAATGRGPWRPRAAGEPGTDSRPRRPTRMRIELFVERGQRRVPAGRRLAAEPLEEMRAPLVEVGDPRRDSLRMEAEPKNVDGRLEQVSGHGAEGRLERAGGPDGTP